jgi:hypothetical protein
VTVVTFCYADATPRIASAALLYNAWSAVGSRPQSLLRARSRADAKTAVRPTRARSRIS